jgi:hypothetical protein
MYLYVYIYMYIYTHIYSHFLLDPMPLPPKAEVDQGVDEDRYRLICTTGDVSCPSNKYDQYHHYFAVTP